MSSNTESREPRILQYGPQRLIGVGRVCKTSADCTNVWSDENGFETRISKARRSGGEGPYYGVCRCATGAEAGAFEYMAAMPVAEGAAVPEGMTEIIIPAGTYAEFPVAGLGDIGRVWAYTGEWLSAHPEWKGFCDGNPDGCGCLATPPFELYQPGFNESGGLFIYVPIQPSA